MGTDRCVQLFPYKVMYKTWAGIVTRELFCVEKDFPLHYPYRHGNIQETSA